MATDARVDWFRPRVCTLLGLPEAKGKALWDGLIADEAALTGFKTFLSGKPCLEMQMVHRPISMPQLRESHLRPVLLAFLGVFCDLKHDSEPMSK